MEMSVPVLLISMLLFFVLFFGIGFLLNMILRMTWLPAILSPIVFIFIIDDVRFFAYFTAPSASFAALKHKIMSHGLPAQESCLNQRWRYYAPVLYLFQ